MWGESLSIFRNECFYSANYEFKSDAINLGKKKYIFL